MPDNKAEWMKKACIDYFSPFVSLWLAFNAWYRTHYCDLENKSDRTFIDKIKSDYSLRNPIFKKFKYLIVEDSAKDNVKFRGDLDAFIFALDYAELRNPNPERYKRVLSFQSALINYADRDDELEYMNLLMPKSESKPKIKLEEHHLINDVEKVFAGLIELIYQVRCLLIHGDLEPTKENHEVVKYCYFLLLALME